MSRARLPAASWPGFYLLRVHDMAFATYIAAAINVAVALLGLALASRTGHRTAADHRKDRGALVARAPAVVFVYAAIAFSGLTALGAEVVWTRLLSLLLGATVYTFSIILAVFLTGPVGRQRRRFFPGPPGSRSTLGAGRLPDPAGAAIAWTAFTLAYVLP